jgi:predicted transcriptional regulator
MMDGWAMKTKLPLGRYLTGVRRTHWLSVSEFADALGTSREMAEALERGEFDDEPNIVDQFVVRLERLGMEPGE